MKSDQLLIAGSILLAVVLVAVWMYRKPIEDEIKSLEQPSSVPLQPPSPSTKGYDANLKTFLSYVSSQINSGTSCEEMWRIWQDAKKKIPLKDNSVERIEASMMGQEAGSDCNDCTTNFCRNVKQVINFWRSGAKGC